MQGSVKVVFSAKGNKSGNTAIDNASGKPKESKEQDDREQDLKKTRRALMYGAIGVAHVLVQEASYEIQKSYDLTDDVVGRRNQQIAKQVINKSISIAGSSLVSFAAGGIIGLAINTALFTTREIISAYQNYDQQQLQIARNNANLEYSRLRAGYSLTSGDKGENR